MIRYYLLPGIDRPCFVFDYRQALQWDSVAGWEDVVQKGKHGHSVPWKMLRKSSLLECVLIGGVDAVV